MDNSDGMTNCAGNKLYEWIGSEMLFNYYHSLSGECFVNDNKRVSLKQSTAPLSCTAGLIKAPKLLRYPCICISPAEMAQKAKMSADNAPTLACCPGSLLRQAWDLAISSSLLVLPLLRKKLDQCLLPRSHSVMGWH